MMRGLVLRILCATAHGWVPNSKSGSITGFLPAFKSRSLLCKDGLRTSGSSRYLSQEVSGAMQIETTPTPLQGKLIASDSIRMAELSTLNGLIQSHIPVQLSSNTVVPLSLQDLSPGVTGRVAIIDLVAGEPIDEDTLEEWQAILCQQIDEILYSEADDSLSQPILLSFVQNTKDSANSKQLMSLIENQLANYDLAESILSKHEEASPPSDPKFVPSLWYEVDGAMVDDGNNNEKWDTSSVLVFDGLVSSDLRAKMLQTLGSGEDWDDINGPDPTLWEEGGLIDLPDEEEDDSASADIPTSYGLTEAALEEVCRDSPPPTAFQQFENILAQLFADFTVTRLPEAVLGDSVTPLAANAPCFGQSFNDHIDGDPYFAPPSPWTDVYGRYANRAQGKPRFVSCLVYLNEEWKEEWGAPTRFYDVSTDTTVDVSPKPGRLVLMDQDITHTVVAPLEAAEKRPRYSLVWKLILHPKQHDQDMRHLSGSHRDWPQPTYIGSARR